MKPLVLSLSAGVLALALAACGGGGAESAGPAPSVSLETAAPAESAGDPIPQCDVGAAPDPKGPCGASFAQAAEYSAQADAICEAATEKLEAAVTELDQTDQSAGRIAKEDLAFEISKEALAELRALPPPPAAAAVNPVALCSHRGGTHETVTRAEYIAQASAICGAANDEWRLGNLTPPEESLRAARIEKEALAQLRALPQPEGDRALLEEAFYSVVEDEIDAIREYAVAAAAGDTARALLVGMERVHLTHQRGNFAFGYGLGSCPMDLPA
jgi:hypothetical protein